MSGFQLPPKVSVRKERIGGQWVYKFRHEEMGQLGRIVLQSRADGNTQANCELAGDHEEPMLGFLAQPYSAMPCGLWTSNYE